MVSKHLMKTRNIFQSILDGREREEKKILTNEDLIVVMVSLVTSQEMMEASTQPSNKICSSGLCE